MNFEIEAEQLVDAMDLNFDPIAQLCVEHHGGAEQPRQFGRAGLGGSRPVIVVRGGDMLRWLVIEFLLGAERSLLGLEQRCWLAASLADLRLVHDPVAGIPVALADCDAAVGMDPRYVAWCKHLNV